MAGPLTLGSSPRRSALTFDHEHGLSSDRDQYSSSCIEQAVRDHWPARAASSGVMTTIYEVARRAGVSPATVSRVLNGGTVSTDKEERVRRAAEELNYVPNRTARRLRKQTSELIALLIPDIENPFFT